MSRVAKRIESGRIGSVRKHIADGLFNAELGEFLYRRLRQYGYVGMEVSRSEKMIEIVITATRPEDVIGEDGVQLRDLTTQIKQRFGIHDTIVSIVVDKVRIRGHCAMAQAETIKTKLVGGMASRRIGNYTIRNIMEAGARGCEVIISGKIRGQRAKSLKMTSGFMVHSGNPALTSVDRAVTSCSLKQGVLGIKVNIMLPEGAMGPKGIVKPLPDVISIREPKELVEAADTIRAQAVQTAN